LGERLSGYGNIKIEQQATGTREGAGKKKRRTAGPGQENNSRLLQKMVGAGPPPVGVMSIELKDRTED
jgi:hypothetical protein